MNEVTKEKIAIAVRNAIDKERLMNKDIAKKFGFHPLYLSYLKNQVYWNKIPDPAWNILKDWMHSGKKLKDYSPPNNTEVENSDQPEEGPAEVENIYNDLNKPKKIRTFGKSTKSKPPESVDLAVKEEQPHHYHLHFYGNSSIKSILKIFEKMANNKKAESMVPERPQKDETIVSYLINDDGKVRTVEGPREAVINLTINLSLE